MPTPATTTSWPVQTTEVRATPLLDQARQIADPGSDWANLRREPGGADITGQPWLARAAAVSAYRRTLSQPGAGGVVPGDVLGSLIHLSFVRLHGIDFPEEERCMHLARAAALSWTARHQDTP